MTATEVYAPPATVGAMPPAPARSATTIPRRDPEAVGEAMRRPLTGFSRDDLVNIVGAMVSAVCSSLLLFGRVAALSGPFGFAVVTFGIFLVTYAFVVSLTEERPLVVDKVMTALFSSAAAIAGLALLSVVSFTLYRGRLALTKTNFYLQDMGNTGPSDPLSSGGIKHAIVGTLIMLSLAIIVTVPLGLACAVFLNETRSRAGNLVRTIVDAMTALPSILAGLFIFATWILILGFERSALAASFAITIMMLPIIIRAADVVLRLVPGNLREASAALGAPLWRTVWHVVLPTARSGLATSIILGVARGVGETAPVLLTAGITASLNTNPFKNPMVSLPLATFEFVRSPQAPMIARGFATAAVLMVVVLVLFAITRFLGGHQAGQATGRQARQMAARSARDVARFTSRRQAGLA